MSGGVTSSGKSGSSMPPDNANLNHFYLEELKYGYPGTDGTTLSNYIAYARNNHELLAIFYSDPHNPYKRYRRMLVHINDLSLQLFLAAAIAVSGADMGFFGEGLLVAIISGPYISLLKEAATCSLCTKENCCLSLAHGCGDCVLFFCVLFSLIYIAIAAILAISQSYFYASFFISVITRYLLFFVAGISNWILVSWGGVCCIPQMRTKEGVWPKEKTCAIWTFWPIRWFMNTLYLCESTYEEDKKAFQEKYPGKVCIAETVDGLVVRSGEATVNPIASNASAYGTRDATSQA
jgi:hypothetical protein